MIRTMKLALLASTVLTVSGHALSAVPPVLTAAAQIQLREGSASGDEPVAAQGPFGTLTSEGFRLTDRGQVVIFTGRSHAVLEGGQ